MRRHQRRLFAVLEPSNFRPIETDFNLHMVCILGLIRLVVRARNGPLRVLLALFMQRQVVMTVIVLGLMKMLVIGTLSDPEIPQLIRLLVLLRQRAQHRMSVVNSRHSAMLVGWPVGSPAYAGVASWPA